MRKLFLRYGRKYLLWCLMLILLIVAQGSVQLFGLTREMKRIVDRGIDAGNMSYLTRSGLRMLLFTALVAACGTVIAWLGARIACSIRRDLTRSCYEKILNMSSQDEAGFGGATLLTRCITDTENVQRLLGFVLGICLLAPVVIVLMLCSLLRVDAQMFAAEAAAVGISLVIMLVLMLRARGHFPVLQESIDSLNLITKEKITGVRTIRAFGREEYEAERGAAVVARVYENEVAANRLLKFVSPSILTIMNLSMVIIYLVGAAKASDGLMQISTLLLIIQYVNSLIPSLSALPIVVNMIPGAEAGLDRIWELLEYGGRTVGAVKDGVGGVPEAVKDGAGEAPEAVKKETGTIAMAEAEDDQADNLHGQQDEQKLPVKTMPALAFRNVTFGYDGHKPTLTHLTFTIPEGSRTGVVGATGSGKSTLLSLMCGLCLPQEGTIQVEGIPLDHMDKAAQMTAFSYVPQKAMVFQDSVRENIRAYHEEIDEEAIRRACDGAVFTEVAQVLEEGLDTMMAQGGMNLSGGQRKRLSLARGLAKDAAVYLLDDPFAALDAVTARAALRGTMQLLSGRTVVMVTQRFSQIADFDQIIVLKDGHIEDIGTHEELLERCGEYADMYRIQCSLESRTPEGEAGRQDMDTAPCIKPWFPKKGGEENGGEL